MAIQVISNPEPNFIPPQILFKETITQKVQSVVGKFLAQSGGRGQYGHVVIDVEPIEAGKGIVFRENIKGEAVPKKFIKSVEEGIRVQALNGILAGYPVTDILITLVDGSSHDVDSSEMAFQLAAKNALREALLKGKSTLLEPIMNCQVNAPDEFFGAVIGDLTTRRSMIISLESAKDRRTVDCRVPLIEMADYARILHVLSKGQASFSIEPGHYAPMPWEIAKRIIENQ